MQKPGKAIAFAGTPSSLQESSNVRLSPTVMRRINVRKVAQHSTVHSKDPKKVASARALVFHDAYIGLDIQTNGLVNGRNYDKEAHSVICISCRCVAAVAVTQVVAVQ